MARVSNVIFLHNNTRNVDEYVADSGHMVRWMQNDMSDKNIKSWKRVLKIEMSNLMFMGSRGQNLVKFKHTAKDRGHARVINFEKLLTEKRFLFEDNRKSCKYCSFEAPRGGDLNHTSRIFLLQIFEKSSCLSEKTTNSTSSKRKHKVEISRWDAILEKPLQVSPPVKYREKG